MTRNTGILYLVGTPIGNLEDVTLRALRTLREVDLIAAEDTRHTQILLNKYEIQTRLTSYHEHNEVRKSEHLVRLLTEGKRLALVSNAGMPCISDPGFRLVQRAVEAKIQIVPVPGPDAATTAAVASGFPLTGYLFGGFLPRKKQERNKRLTELSARTETVIIYESPKRVMDTLDALEKICPDRQALIARELTKFHEEMLRGTVSELYQQIKQRELLGEFVLVLAGAKQSIVPSLDGLGEKIQRMRRATGISTSDAAKILIILLGIPRSLAYKLALEARRQ